MLGVFYAYTEEYKHNHCFIKTKTNNMYKIKLHKTSKCLWPIYTDMFVVKSMFFFNIFRNLFPKIHRGVLCKIAIYLLHFRDIYEVNLREKNLAEVWLINAGQMSLYNFLILRKERDSNTGVLLWYLWNLQE